jgi:hypothetical protein
MAGIYRKRAYKGLVGGEARKDADKRYRAVAGRRGGPIGLKKGGKEP